ncbi:MAG: phosphoribosyl-AMP cyclohydrolase [Acidobacteriaceae bacterium]|jgi:phosphoribosyl-ATP pyrophosphohydrolase/phosphoribosyl-AMP cyclohydrolase
MTIPLSNYAEVLEIDFEKMLSLIPAIVQDAANGDVLMLGFMNREAWQRTLAGGYVTFFSRTRNQLWTKGESSGNRLKVVSASTDCDRDTLLLKVSVEGEGLVCHEGTRSCFTRDISLSSDTAASAESGLRSERDR